MLTNSARTLSGPFPYILLLALIMAPGPCLQSDSMGSLSHRAQLTLVGRDSRRPGSIGPQPSSKLCKVPRDMRSLNITPDEAFSRRTEGRRNDNGHAQIVVHSCYWVRDEYQHCAFSSTPLCFSSFKFEEAGKIAEPLRAEVSYENCLKSS